MKKLIINSVTAVTLSVLASTALATHDRGAYVEANAGWAYGSATVEIPGLFSITKRTSTWGANGNAGYQFNRYIAAEAGYTYFGGDINASLGDVAVKGIFPVADKISLFAKAGAGYMGSNNGNNTSNQWVAVYGVGAAYELTQNLDINAQYQGATFWNGFGSTNFGLVSSGLTYHFPV